ncbi:MAG TPA: hypothetical protein VGK40_07555 [Verrucomicrobiae bacterium]|jgi:hypothetical protein
MKANKMVRMESVRNRISALFVSGLICVALGAAGLVRGESKGDVAISLVAQKVSIAADGKEVLRVADRAMPGEVIQYDARYKNGGKEKVRSLEPTLPIPPGLEYLPDSAKPAPAKASLDGKKFAPVPLTRPVRMPDGQVVEQAVPFSEYRALRWNVGDLPAGESVTVSARARLSTGKP